MCVCVRERDAKTDRIKRERREKEGEREDRVRDRDKKIERKEIHKDTERIIIILYLLIQALSNFSPF